MKVKESGGPFEVAVENTRSPMVFVDAVSGQYEIVYANASFLRLMRCKTTSDIIGIPFLSIVSGTKAAGLFKPVKSRDGVRRPIHYLNAIKSTGEIFTVALLIAPVTDTSGNITQFFVSFVDTSDHLDFDGQNQERARSLYLNTPGFIATTTGREHRFTFVNDAYLALVGARDLIGVTVASALPEVVDQGFIQLLDDVYETKRPFSGRRVPVALVREAGCHPEKRFIDFVYQPILDANEEVTGLFCEGFDVTEIEEKEAQLRLLEAQFVELSRLNAMGTMAAMLAHELNQPLAAISNYASGCLTMLHDREGNAETIKGGLEAITGASERAGEIIRRLRDMTKRTPPAVEEFDLADSLADAINLVKAGSFCEVLISSHSAITGKVRADRVQVQQVIINLLKNACEAAAAAPEGSVSVSISRSNHEIRLSVVDDGHGVSADKQSTLFTWMESDKPNGMGIGLSVSRTIIENQGGKIWLEKTSSLGSEFAFTLPAAK